jgi:hypothetical protein
MNYYLFWGEVGAQNSRNNFSFLTAFGCKPVKEHHLEVSHCVLQAAHPLGTPELPQYQSPRM